MTRRSAWAVLVASLASVLAASNARVPLGFADVGKTKKMGPRGVKRSLASYDSFEEEVISYEEEYYGSKEDHSSHDVYPSDSSSSEGYYATNYERDPWGAWSAYFGGTHYEKKSKGKKKKGDKKDGKKKDGKVKSEAHKTVGKKTKGIKAEKVAPAKHVKGDAKADKATKTEHNRPNAVYGHPIWDDYDFGKPAHSASVQDKPKPHHETEHESVYPTEKPYHEGDHIDTERGVVVRFALQFTIGIPGELSLNEVAVITAETGVYLTDYQTLFFENYTPNITMDYFSLFTTEGVPPVVHDDTISLDYKGVTFFESYAVPTVAEMTEILEDAFIGDNLKEYLRRVNTLSSENVFSTTTVVIMLTTVTDNEPSALFKTLEDESSDVTSSVSPVNHSTNKTRHVVIVAVGAAAVVTLVVALSVYRRQHRKRAKESDEYFIGDEKSFVEREIGDEDFDVSSCSSATRAQNFLRLVAREGDGDDDGGSSTFRIEMGGNKSISRS